MAKSNSIPRDVRTTLYIDGKPAEGSMKSIEQVTSRLRREMKGLEIGTDEWNKKFRDVQTNTRYLRQLRGELNGVGDSMAALKGHLKDIALTGIGIIGLDRLNQGFYDLVQQNAALSDSLADVRKTTGLTEVQVRMLDNQLKKINTRSTRDELLGLAREAGKLGISGTKSILEFVRAADQIAVALGEDLGGSEGAINAIGKLTDIFRMKETYGIERAMLMVGSLLNELGASGAASEKYLVNFTNRMAGIAPMANMSIESIMAIAAVMDEMAQQAESSSTAIGQFVVGLGKDVPKFARIAGMSVEEFSGLLKKDGAEALMAVLKNVNATGGGVEKLAANMGMVGEEGAKAVAALGVLSSSLDKYYEKLEIGRTATEEAISVTNEFSVKNNNLAAVTEKLEKEYSRFTTNHVMIDFLIRVIRFASEVVGWLDRNAEALVRLAKFVAIGTSAWAVYRGATLLLNTALLQYILLGKQSVAIMALKRTASIALAGAMALLSGNLVKARQAARLLNITLAANPYAAVLALLAAVTTGLVLFSGKLGVAAQSMKDLADAALEAEKATLSERLAIERGIRTAMDDSKARQLRLSAIDDLRRIMPEVLKQYSDEEIMAGKAAAAVKKHTDSLLEQARVRALTSKYEELEGRNLEIDSEINRDSGGTGPINKWLNTFRGRFTGESGRDVYQSGLERERDENKARQAELEAEIDTIAEGMAQRVAETMEGAVEGAVNTIAEKRKFLAKEIDRLKALYEDLDLSDSAGRKANLAQQKALQAQLDALDGKSPKASKGNETDQIKKDQEDLKKFLAKNNEEIYLNTLEKESREWAVLWNKYDNQRKQAHGNAELLRQIDEQEKAEEQALLEKHNAECLKLEKDYADKVKEISGKVYEAGLSDQELELYTVRKHYEELIRLAEQYGIDATALREKLAAAENEITDRQREKDAEKEKERIKQWKGVAIDTADEIASTILSINANRNQAEFDARIEQLEKQRDRELANEDLTNAQREAINAKYDAKIKAEKRKAFLAERNAAISAAVINGLVGAGKLWVEPGWPAALPLTALLAAQTAAAVAEISSRKPPAYAGGGMTDEDPAGYVSKATIFRRSASGRPFMAGEAGREWIAPNWMLQDPRLADIFNTLESIRAEKRGYAAGGSTAAPPQSDTAGTAYDFFRLEREIGLMRKDFSRIKDQKVVFVYQDFARFMKNIEYAQNSQSG